MTMQREQQNEQNGIVPYQAPQQEVNLAEFRQKGYNILSPTDKMQRVSPFHVMRVSIVQLDVEEGGGDVYHSRTFCKDDERALSKNALLKISRAAGLELMPRPYTQRTDDNSDPAYRSYVATYRLRQPDGGYTIFQAEKEVDSRAGGASEADLKKQAIGKMKKRKFGDRWVDPEFKTQEEADAWVERELIAARANALANAETKAKLRAIREALAIKSKYKLEELKRPFVVPRLDFCPDMSDPNIRQYMLTAGIQAQGALYGQPPALPGQQQPHIVDAVTSGSSTMEIPEGATIHRASGPEEDEYGADGEQGAFDFAPIETPHDPVTGVVEQHGVDRLHDLLTAIHQADASEFNRLAGECRAAKDAGKYTPEESSRLSAAFSARRAVLMPGQ